MAKKSRTPPPPRRPVQAPSKRVDARDPQESRRALLILVGIALLGLVMLGGVLLWLSLRDNSAEGSQAFAAQMREGGCTYRKMADEGRGHVRDGTIVAYKSRPVATSGEHYGVPAIWNSYEEPIEQERLVHNLEHGGIVIQYGRGVPRATVDQLNEFYLDDPNGMILAPLPRLGDTIAVSAWLQLATCTRFDEDAFEAFRDRFRYKAPERFPPDALVPGR